MPLECLRCRARFDEPIWTGCPRCAVDGVSVNLTVAVDLGSLAGSVTRESFPRSPRSLWRFRATLPVKGEPVTLGEGMTPLIPLERLGRRIGLERLYAKDESRNPTWSYKDRLCSVAVSHAVESGARVLTTLIYALRARRLRYGMASLCIGGGMGIAMAVEAL